MAQRLVTISTAEISREAANYTIGFANLTVQDRVEDALCAGSGTLVSVGQIHGVLTAAHVLEALPDKGAVGIIRLHGELVQYQKQTIEMDHAVKLVIRANEFGPDGPDIGFLRLPPESVGWIAAINSFYDLRRYRDEIMSGQAPAPDFVDAVVGLIDERTKLAPPLGRFERRKGFEAIFTNGSIVNVRTVNGQKLLEFVPSAYPDFNLPNNFQGTSGGTLWRLYIGLESNLPKIINRRLWGVPFYQARGKDGVRVLTCHGPDSVYQSVFDTIVSKWPNDSKRSPD